MGERSRALEAVVIDSRFWHGRRVFLTGHTGFKGAWTALLLQRLGAEVTGYALEPQSERDLFVSARVADCLTHRVADIRDLDRLCDAMAQSGAEILIHMAAQSIVSVSYQRPVETYVTNVIGTVHVLEAARQARNIKAAVVVTSDKCYEPVDTIGGYQETDRLGGRDPYSNSKGCAELVTAAYRRSFLAALDCRVASARAGNVIGGGDWSCDRLVPDAMRALLADETLQIRQPQAVRPWQHVLDPVIGYLVLAQRLIERGQDMAEEWNFGPDVLNETTVEQVVAGLADRCGTAFKWVVAPSDRFAETKVLRLDCSKAQSRLGWSPKIDLATALDLTVEWYQGFRTGTNVRAITLEQIDRILAF
jgi:CDP-glucose 4,6-dehydratase